MPFLKGSDLTYRNGRGLKTPPSLNFGTVNVGSDNFCVDRYVGIWKKVKNVYIVVSFDAEFHDDYFDISHDLLFGKFKHELDI